MADPKPSTGDCIMTSVTAIANSAIPEEPPSIAQNIESLDLVEPQSIRTKLRTYATLLALYVRDASLDL
jgi:hypothetical protein